MNQILFDYVIKLIFAVASIWVTMYLVPYLRTLSENKNNEQLKKFIKETVKAAEQLYKDNKSGQSKLTYVTEKANVWLLKHNIEMNESDLRALIESFVYDINNIKEVITND